MPMLVKPSRYIRTAPIEHPLARQIESLPAAEDILSTFWTFHGALQAEGYRLGIKFLDCGIYILRDSLQGRSNRHSKDPIHVLYPQFRPAPNPDDDKYPTPPISPEDAASCLAGMQAQQRKFRLFEHEDSENWEKLGWPTRIDPLQLSYHSSNIYVTPLDSKTYFLSIDDVKTKEKREKLAELDIQPCLVTVSSIDPETGEENQQWVVKIPKLPQSRQSLNLIEHFARHLKKPEDDKAIRTLAQHLNTLAGDSDVKSCTRDFRLPGFFQLKKKYVERGIFHVVTIKHAEDVTCPIAESMYHKLHRETEKASAKRVRPVSRRTDQHALSVDASTNPVTRPVARSAEKSAGVKPTGAPASRPDPDFYPNNPIYMAHAREIQRLDPKDPKLAPGRTNSKFKCLQRMCVTESLSGIDQNTEFFQHVKRCLRDVPKNLYIYLRVEAEVDNYHNDLPTAPASFQMHCRDALNYHGNPEKAVRDAARRMFFLRYTRSVIERTLDEAGIENAAEIALWACTPANSQIQAAAKRLRFWELIENKAAGCGVSAVTFGRHGQEERGKSTLPRWRQAGENYEKEATRPRPKIPRARPLVDPV